MKKLLLFFAFFGSYYTMQAQCSNPQSQIDIHSNNIQARVLNGGDLFTDFTDGQFIPNPDPNGAASPSTIYSAGLWMGGIDPAGNLKLATSDYRSSTTFDFAAGPLSENGVTDATTCANWDRHFRVTDAEVGAFLAALPLSVPDAIAQFPSIMGWPAQGNSTFVDIWGFDLPFTSQPLAPFFDNDNNGLYNPLNGDYPVVQLRGFEPFLPAEIIWCVFNDQKGGGPHSNSLGNAFQAEIQLTVWAMSCPNQSVLNNTIFTSHRIINRASELIDSAFIALWVDIDLGCGLDDYVGCNPNLKTVFAYNQDPIDGQPGATCSGVPTFEDTPPVQTVTLLNQPLSKFMYYNNSGGNVPPATTDPTAPNEFYNYLTGSWRDGTPLTYGNSGYGQSVPTDYAFTETPEDPNGWSMCTANLAASDRRVLMSSKLGQMAPGQIDEFNAAWTVHFNTPPPCNLGNALNEVAILHAIYEDGFADPCSPALKAPVLPADSLDLFPNPANGDATLRYGAIQVNEIRIFNAAGNLVQTLHQPEKGETLIKTSHLPAGMYAIRLFTDQGNVTKKLAVIR